MTKAPIPLNEEMRLQELRSLDILDTPYEDEFDDVVKLASHICGVPISLISLLEADRQWFKAKVGIAAVETPRAISFCAHTIAQDEDIFEIPDATLDSRFLDNPLVQEDPHIRFYAGTPLISRNGLKLGTLCVADTKAHLLTKEQSLALKVLGRQVAQLIELRRSNKELRKHTKLLNQQAEMQRSMLSIIAHDVRNPIGALKMALELSSSGLVSEEEKKLLAEMFSRQLDHTLDLLNNLVDWGNMHLQANCAKTEKLHLATLVKDILSSFGLASMLKNNRMLNLVDESLFLDSDANIMQFIIRNLVANANKFTSDGTITLYAHGEKNKVVMTVSDTGTGICPDRLKELFNKGHLISTPGTSKEKGSGLGLVLVRDFIELIDGSIDIKSKLGEGTTVFLELKI